MSWNIFLLAFCRFISCSNVFDFNFECTRALLSNLNSKDYGIPPSEPELPELLIQSYDAEDENSKSRIEHLPLDVLAYVFEYLDDIEGFHFMIISRTFKKAGKSANRKRLSSFSPYFVFRQDWLNHVMACHLNNLFPRTTKLGDADIYDKFESIQLERIRGRTCDDRIGFHPLIEYKLQSFIHEMLYGSQELMPLNTRQWSLFFFNKLSKHDYTCTLQYYISTVEENLNICSACDEYISHETRILLSLLLNLYKEPLTDLNYMEFSREIAALGFESYSYHCLNFEFKVLNHANFHHITVPDHMNSGQFENIILEKLFSKSFFDRFPVGSDRILNMLSNTNILSNRLIFPELGNLKGEVADILRLLVRDPMKIVHSSRISAKMISIIGQVSNPDLNLIDMFSRGIRENVFDFSQIYTGEDSLISLFFNNGHAIFFKTVLSEATTPINIFIEQKSTGSLENIFNCMHNFDSVKFQIYIQYLLTRGKGNPLPLIFVHTPRLNYCSGLICNNFKLNHLYLIDFDFDRIVNTGSSRLSSLTSFRGQILTFKQIIANIQHLFDFRMMNIFTSHPDMLDHQTLEDSRIFSINEFITTGRLD